MYFCPRLETRSNARVSKAELRRRPKELIGDYVMSDAERREQVTRDAILKLLSDEENGMVSTAEAVPRLTEGAEYLDLERLDRGVQRASATTAKVTMGRVLPRSAVSDETWRKILAQLAGGNQPSSPARAQETGVAAVRRLYHDPAFVIHFAAYLAVNILLIVINLATTPGKYWFYWPLLGWGVGIAGHAYGVFRRPRPSLRKARPGTRHVGLSTRPRDGFAKPILWNSTKDAPQKVT